MGFVDLSAYDESATKAPTKRVELIDSRGRRRTLEDVGEEMEGVLVDFLRGRVSLENVAPVVSTEGEGSGSNLLMRIVRELL